MPARKKKFNPVKTFLKIVCSMVLTFVILAGGACFGYYKATGNVPFSGDGIVTNVNHNNVNFLDALLKKNLKMNVAVFGVDKDGTRTDVVFVAHYDSAQESVSLVSLPRDTRVSLSPDVESLLESKKRTYNAVTKLNAVHAYGGKDACCEATVMQIEDFLGIKIDHYVKINLEAFRAIVDAVGGVEVDVPQDMYWDMRDTGDPLINLKKGVQLLDGDKAEQLVRFRRYADGDVGRIQVQQQFLKALAEKVLSTETIVKNLGEYISVVYKYVDTDISMADAMKYANYIDQIDMNKITMETLPGAGEYIGGVSYFVNDTDATREMVDRIFYNTGTSTDTATATASPVVQQQEEVKEKPVQIDSKTLLIEVCNGGYKDGMAGKYTDMLKAEGYQTSKPTTYKKEQLEHTRIQVRQEGTGQDLVSYFSDARIEQMPADYTGEADIRIVIGTRQK